MKALGRHLSMSAVAVFIVGGFIGGIAAIWLYAAARPRFGAGPKTAALTGFAYWVVGYALPTLGQMPLGLFPKRLLVVGGIVGLVELLRTMLGINNGFVRADDGVHILKKHDPWPCEARSIQVDDRRLGEVIKHSLDRGAKANSGFTNRQSCLSHAAIGETLNVINCGNLIRVPPRIVTVCRAYASRHRQKRTGR